jgi:hypothetical protein
LLPALLAVSGCMGGAAGQAAAADQTDRQWQLEMVFHPSPQQLAMERKGRVMIYSGLRDTDVRRALDEQWDRVESMMFIRTIVTRPSGRILRDSETGYPVVGDDDC